MNRPVQLQISQTGDLAKGLRTPREFDFGGQWDLITELTQNWGNRLSEGTNTTLCAPGPRRKEQGPQSLMGSLDPGAHKVLFEPSKHLWQLWSLILNVILPLLPSYWGFSFALGHRVSLFGGTQHSPVDSCSAAVSCNFGVLTGEDEYMSFYSMILPVNHLPVIKTMP